MTKGFLTIELTPSKIRYMYLNRDGRGYKVLKTGVELHTLNVLTAGGLARSLQDLIKKEAMAPQRLFITLCLQENYIRQVQMPKMNLHELEEAITAEIEKYPVLNNRKFDYIYNASYYSKDKGNVVFAGVEQSVLNYIFSECRKVGIPFQHLEIAPLNVKELLPLIEPSAESQVILVVHDQISYLSIIRGRQCRLLYKAGIGIEHLYPHHNDKVNETILFNLIGELQRVLKAYLSQHKIEKLAKIWLVWDQDGAAGLEQAMTGQLGLDVEVLSLSRLAKFQKNLDQKSSNPIYVLSATPAIIHLENIKEQFPLNHFFRAVHFKRYIFKLIAGALLVLGLAGYLLGMKSFEYYQKQRAIKAQISEVTNTIANLKTATQELYRKRDEYLIVRQGLLDQANYIKTLNRVSWSEVLSVFSKEMPKDMALTSFKFNETGNVSFIGESLEVETVAELIRRMDDSAILEQGKFDFLTEKKVEEQKIFGFGILAQLQSNNEPEKSVNHE